MFEEHQQFIYPPEDTVLWRYMDFPKFVSLLDKKAMHFCRADLLGDPYEGSYPRGSVLARDQHFMEYDEKLRNVLFANSRNSRRQMYINCWHINPIESDAMWNLYTSRSNEGIAIRTTFKKLRDSFKSTEKSLFIGRVFYIDYNSALWMGTISNSDTGEKRPAPDFGGGFHAVLHKRHSFEHEKELRCLFWQPHIRNEKIDLTCQDIPSGHLIDTDLGCLIESIYIAPKAGKWFEELTSNIIKMYGYSFNVVHSILSEEPVF